MATIRSGHSRAAGMKQQIDAPIAQLVLDLEERGLLNRTLIVLASEFGRDMMVEGKPGKVVKYQVIVPPVIVEPKHFGMPFDVFGRFIGCCESKHGWRFRECRLARRDALFEPECLSTIRPILLVHPFAIEADDIRM